MFRRASLLLLRIRFSLRRRGYQKTQEWLSANLPGDVAPVGAPDEVTERVARTCRMVRAAERYGPGAASCLEESLALWYLLREQGLDCALRVGVRKEGGAFEAHAWVERDGAALNQTDEQHRHYAAFEGEMAGRRGDPS